MVAALYTLYVINSLFLIMVVLLQAGRGGGLSFAGGNTAGQVFSATGGTTFLQKMTVGSAAGFMVMSLLLAYISSSPGAVDTGSYAEPETEAAAGDSTASPVDPAAAPAAPADPAAAPAAPADPAAAPAAPAGGE
jgi:preprotein translocase subunit SecG